MDIVDIVNNVNIVLELGYPAREPGHPAREPGGTRHGIHILLILWKLRIFLILWILRILRTL